MMKKLLALSVALIFLVVGCGQGKTSGADNKDGFLEQQDGVIVDIQKQQKGRSQILVIPNINKEDISNKKQSELIKMAQKKGGAFYGFETDKYKELNVGDHVNVYWNGSQGDSDPPQREIEKIDIISK